MGREICVHGVILVDKDDSRGFCPECATQDEWRERCEELQDENERLRAALKKVEARRARKRVTF